MSAFGILAYGVSGVPSERQVDPLPLLGIFAALAIGLAVVCLGGDVLREPSER